MRPKSARSRALLIGTGWTLAVMTLAWFKSSADEPIYLWPLGAVALGWAGVVAYALGREQRAAAAWAEAAARDCRAVVEGLAQAMGAQMQQTCGELVCVDDLLGHAIKQLTAAFKGMNEQMGRQQSELARLAAAAPGAPTTDPLHAAAERVAIEVNDAVTALQFRDVVGQKLGHVRRELDALQQAMRRLRELSAAPAAAAPALAGAPEHAYIAARVQDLLRELEQAKAISPARQELMHAGEVDLF